MTNQELIQALRQCAISESSELPPCDSCPLYSLSKGGYMSTGMTCFEHLVVDAAARLAEKETENTRLLTENERLRAKFAEERAKTKKLVDSAADLLLARDRLQAQVAETRAHDIANTRSVARLCGELSALRAQLAESQRRERAATEDISAVAYHERKMPCIVCTRKNAFGDELRKHCQNCNQFNSHFEWRGPQAGKGKPDEN